MKRLIIFFILSFLLFPNMGLFSDSMDFVIMVDTSESIFPYFPDIMNYLIKDIITGNLHTGDTFHLLNFAGKPEVDISEKIKDEKTVENILKKLLLLQPLGKYTDLVRAVKFLYQYIKELPENTEKNILLITDGIHDPPPDSPYKYNSSKILKELLQNMQEIKKEGWSIHIMQFPKAINETAGSKKSFLPEISNTLLKSLKKKLCGRTTISLSCVLRIASFKASLAPFIFLPIFPAICSAIFQTCPE